MKEQRLMHKLYDVHGFKIWLDVSESHMMQSRANGTYEIGKVNFIKKHLKPGMTFVDVGACKGYFAMLAASIVGEEGLVVAFEPESENMKRLFRTRAENIDYKVILYNAALGSTVTVKKLHLGKKSGFNSLLTNDGSIGVIDINTYRLDETITDGNIDMIKIDVEGYELEVLKGATRTLLDNHDVVLLMDLHPQLGVDVLEVCEFLYEYAFFIYDMDGNKIEPHSNIREIMAKRPEWAREIMARRA